MEDSQAGRRRRHATQSRASNHRTLRDFPIGWFHVRSTSDQNGCSVGQKWVSGVPQLKDGSAFANPVCESAKTGRRSPFARAPIRALPAQPVLPSGDLDDVGHSGQQLGDAVPERPVPGLVAGLQNGRRDVLHCHRASSSPEHTLDEIPERSFSGTGRSALSGDSRDGSGCSQRSEGPVHRGKLRIDLRALGGQIVPVRAQLANDACDSRPRSSASACRGRRDAPNSPARGGLPGALSSRLFPLPSGVHRVSVPPQMSGHRERTTARRAPVPAGLCHVCSPGW